jgi:hypothetical protein
LQSSVSRLRRLRSPARSRTVDADDGLDAELQSLAIELHHREQIVLVGDGDRGHAERRARSTSSGMRTTLSCSENSVCRREVDESGGRHGARVYTRTRAFIRVGKKIQRHQT